MRDKVVTAGVLVMAACAIVSTAFTVWRNIWPAPAERPRAGLTTSIEPNWASYADGGHVLGSPSAPVTIVEFADFQCPFCRAFEESIDSLRARDPAVVKLVFRHYPLEMHKFALGAARASECAGDQGRFASMHHALYAHQDSLGGSSWSWFASLASVPNIRAFEQCVSSERHFSGLAADTIAGIRLKIGGTPTLLINDLRVDGAPSLDSLEAYVSRAKAAALRTR